MRRCADDPPPSPCDWCDEDPETCGREPDDCGAEDEEARFEALREMYD